MRKQIHILNGDALKEQFPNSLPGETIITRECLADGDVEGNSLAEFFNLRANFISNSYEGTTTDDYFKMTVSEFQRMHNIPETSDVNFWFEDDLFCQVNFWFVINLVSKAHRGYRYFLVRPTTHTQHGFGGLDTGELVSIYENRTELTEFDELSSLWEAYQSNDIEKLIKVSNLLKNQYPFISNAVKAHVDRIPSDGNLGRPTDVLISIMKELGTDEFGTVFNAFNKRESIYGFGDLQVKRLCDAIVKNGLLESK